MKIKLNKNKSVLSTNQDSFMGLDFVVTKRELPYNDLVKDIDTNEVYFNELNKSNNYRITLTIDSVFTNVLTNLTGGDSLSTFNEPLFRDVNSPLNASLKDKTKISYSDSIDRHLTLENGWLGYYKPNGLSIDCNLIELHPKKNELYFVNEDKSNNWVFGLFYLKSKEYIKHSDGTNIGHTGIAIYKFTEENINGRDLVRVNTIMRHGLKNGDLINIQNSSTMNGVRTVMFCDSQNEFYIDAPFTILPTEAKPFLKRVVNGIESEYYIRKLGVITDNREADLLNKRNSNGIPMQMGFANNVYGDSVTQVVFNNDTKIGNLRDYRNRPLTEIIVGMFKVKNNSMTNVKSGFDLPIPAIGQYYPIVGQIKSTSTINNKQCLEDNIVYNNGLVNIGDNNEFFYDFVEFNANEQQEHVLADVYHTFNYQNRLNGGTVGSTTLGSREEGYLYKPFHSIQIREESEEVYNGDSYDILPDYADEFRPMKFKWRDIYDRDKSLIKFPFNNGCHYINKTIKFMLERQDPFDTFGLRYDTFPRDKAGSRNPFRNEFIDSNTQFDGC